MSQLLYHPSVMRWSCFITPPIMVFLQIPQLLHTYHRQTEKCKHIWQFRVWQLNAYVYNSWKNHLGPPGSFCTWCSHHQHRAIQNIDNHNGPTVLGKSIFMHKFTSLADQDASGYVSHKGHGISCLWLLPKPITGGITIHFLYWCSEWGATNSLCHVLHMGIRHSG